MAKSQKQKIKKIWKLAIPYLKKGIRKDFLVHTKGVVKAMKLLLKKEKGDPNILIPAAILHDVGWAKVPAKLQKSKDKKEVRKAMELHLKYAVPIIKEILGKVGYKRNQIKKVVEIVLSHKYHNPRRHDKRLLIDADNLSDIFKDQFYSDCRVYKISPKEFLKIRRENKFYTKTAQEIFQKELKKREKEILKKENELETNN